ncbi:MAG: hypothetical protein ABSE42_05860 [Bryobacteraceae bacterium]
MALLVCLFATWCWLSIRVTGGQYIYPLDDTYIGMTMAKNLARNGTWGINPGEFASAASSPAYWLVLAACYRVTGVNEWWPLALSLLSCMLALAFADRFFLRTLPPLWRVAGLGLLVLLVPLPVIALLGMDHAIHIAASIAFLGLFYQRLSEPDRPVWPVLAFAPVLVLIRYEGLAMIAVCAVLFAAKRRFGAAAALVASAALGVIAYGAISLSNGWGILPAGVRLKGTLDSVPATLFWKPLAAVRFSRYCLGLAVASALTLVIGSKAQRPVAIVVAASILLHLQFGQLGWVYRYEAYLIALVLVALCFCLSAAQPQRWAIAGAALAVALLSTRAVAAFADLPTHSRAIFVQQYRTARFVKQYYSGSAVVLNDIGMVAFMADSPCIDLVGLGTRGIYQAKVERRYTTDVIRQQSSHAKIAILYDGWFGDDWQHLGIRMGGPSLPSEWIAVGTWTTPPWTQGFLGSRTVTFYAVDPTEAPALREHLKDFSVTVPESSFQFNDRL